MLVQDLSNTLNSELNLKDYKKEFLFDRINKQSFFIFCYYTGTLKVADFRIYQTDLEALGLQAFRFKESSFFVNKKLRYPLLQGNFCFLFPRLDCASEPYCTKPLYDSLCSFVEKDPLNYFLPVCLGTETTLRTFSFHFYFVKFVSSYKLNQSFWSLQLLSFFFLVLTFLIKKTTLFINFLNGYNKSINKV